MADVPRSHICLKVSSGCQGPEIPGPLARKGGLSGSVDRRWLLLHEGVTMADTKPADDVNPFIRNILNRQIHRQKGDECLPGAGE